MGYAFPVQVVCLICERLSQKVSLFFPQRHKGHKAAYYYSREVFVIFVTLWEFSL